MPRTISNKKHYDLIIIGGGIYGAVLLWEAVNRGYKAILVESGDFCSGTTANTAKILHGGIRYLQSLNLHRIKESSRDQQRFCELAPHLTAQLPCLMPTDKSLTRNKVVMRLGFGFYNLLLKLFSTKRPHRALFDNKVLSQKQALEEIGWLDPSSFTGAAKWVDAQAVNAERLGYSFVKTATLSGGDAINYLKVVDITSEEEVVTGITAVDQLNGHPIALSGSAVVTATGHWSHGLLKAKCPRLPITRKYQRAVNLLAPIKLSDYALGLKAKNKKNETDNRLLFASPWQDQTLFGTWYLEPEQTSDTGRAAINDSEIEQCLSEVNATFGDLSLTKEDLSLVHLGHLPVGNHNLLSEKEEIIDAFNHGGPKGLFAVIGVKYTTALSVAAKTIDLLQLKKHSGTSTPLSNETPFYGRDPRPREQGIFSARVEHASTLIPPKTLKRLEQNYGQVKDQILTLAINDPSLLEPIPGALNTLCAEIPYILEHESAQRVTDLLIRRMGIGGCGKPSKETLSFCATQMGIYFDWNKEQIRDELNRVDDYYKHREAVRI